jgi:hypothetical protein
MPEECHPQLTILREIDSISLMNRKFYFGIFIIFLIVFPFATPLHAAAEEEDPCAKDGLHIRNETTIDLWVKKNDGACTLWTHHHIIIVKPEDTLEIFSDLTCSTLYCGEKPSYEDFQFIDKNGDCRVKILPSCTLSDM